MKLQVKHTPQDSIHEFIIQKLNFLVVVDFRFVSPLHSCVHNELWIHTLDSYEISLGSVSLNSM